MPIYEYQCQSCNYYFEELQKINEPPLKDCPACGKPKLKRLISHTQFQLKGGGWYATDYKKPTTEEKQASKEKEKPKKTTESAKEKSTPAPKSEDKKT